MAQGTRVRDYETNRLTTRPTKEALDVLRSVPTAYVSDYLKQIGIINHTGRGIRPIQPLAEGQVSVAGAAVTMYFAPVSEAYPYTDAPYMHTEVVEQAEEGVIVVIAGQGAPYGFWGDHTTHQAINQKLSAVVIHGYTRDSRAIIETGFPCFSTGITFESYVRRYDPVAYNIPVDLGGAMVRPGDVLVGDDDGIVVIPVEVFDQVVAGVLQIRDAEDHLRKAVADHKPWDEIYPEIHRLKYLASDE
jgi:4-hydroxy-4-methyl-2-oxoglutarate aldolase